jgi:hypothetical protein
MPHLSAHLPISMSRISRTPRFCLLVLIAAWALPSLVHAQAEQAPPPPQLEKLEEGEAPAVTIRQPEQKQHINEKRAPGGRTTQVRVTQGNNTYYLKPGDPAGTSAGMVEASPNRAAQWEVLQFDLGQRAEQERQAQAAEAAPPPPPPPQEGKKK